MKVSELKADLDALSRSVKAEFEAVDRRFEAIDSRFEAVDRRFNAIDARFDAVDARFDALRQEVRDEIAREGVTTRRHIDVVAESIKADVAVFMARLVTLDQRVTVVRSEQTTRAGALSDHEVRLQALERPRG